MDRKAKQRAILKEPWCVICQDEMAVDPHHVLLRSQGGDDVAANLVGLCRGCHNRITAEDPVTRRMLGDYILEHRWDTLGYLEENVGDFRAWMQRRLLVRMSYRAGYNPASHGNGDLQHPEVEAHQPSGAGT